MKGDYLATLIAKLSQTQQLTILDPSASLVSAKRWLVILKILCFGK